MNAKELATLLRLRTEALSRTLEENSALKIALGKRLGGGIETENYHHQLVCKRCLAIVNIPDNHACGDGS